MSDEKHKPTCSAVATDISDMGPCDCSFDHEEDLCAHCGGLKAVRNPTGNCDHMYWPDLLTDEAKRANGYRRQRITVWSK